jgi:dienelactone hydrolase
VESLSNWDLQGLRQEIQPAAAPLPVTLVPTGSWRSVTAARASGFAVRVPDTGCPSSRLSREIQMSLRCSAGLLALLCAGPVAAGHAQGPAEGPARGPLPRGQWPVGFTSLHAADSTRPLKPGQPRPLEIGLWYPARDGSRTRQTYRDYVAPTSSSGRDLDQLIALLESHGAGAGAVQAWLNAPMLAAAGAPRAGGRFPLVLVAQGNGQTVPDQAPLAECLASYGYVVATMPSPMRISGPLTDERAMGARAEEQVRDLAFARGVLAARPDIAGPRFGVIGHSFGARGALLLAMLEPDVAALISLDGGIGTATGRSSLEALPIYRAAAVRAPVLHFYEQLDAFMAPDFGLLRSLTASDRWLVKVPALHHHHFTSLGAMSIEQPALRRAIGATDTTAWAYASVVRATREFLDAFVKADSTSRAHWRSQRGWQYLGPVEELPPTSQ